jgi:phosphinothricin acetyltransferase
MTACVECVALLVPARPGRLPRLAAVDPAPAQAGGVALRPVTAADAEAVSRIYAHHVEHSVATFDLEAPDPDGWLARSADITSAGWPFLVAARAGAEQAVAVIADSGDPASAALHRALGFSEAGRLRRVGRKHGRVLDVVLMQASLA